MICRRCRNVMIRPPIVCGHCYMLPNGCLLRPGGRIRLSTTQAFLIPNHVVDRLGLVLDADAASPGSEVIYWPA